MQRWTCSEITRLAVTMGLLCCFVTMSETFLATPPEVRVSRPLFLRRRTKSLGQGQNQATSLFSNISLWRCARIHFVPLAWESTGGATDTVHATIRKWTDLEGARSGYAAHLIRRNLYAQISCCL